MRLPSLPLLSLALSLVAVPAFALTPADSDTAKATIGAFDDTLLSTMKDGQTLGYKGRYDRMAGAVDKSFDVEFMTKFLLASKWNDLSADQQKTLVAAFRKYTIGEYANRFTDYDGETLKIVSEPTDQRDAVRVQTELTPKTGAPVKLDYILHHTDKGLQIIDIFLQGTISELATERSQFQSVLASSGFDGLIAMLDKKAGDGSTSATAQSPANGSGPDQKQ